MTILSDFESGMCCLINANWAFSNIKSLSKRLFYLFRLILKLNFCLIKNETNKGLGKCIFMHNDNCLRKNRCPLYASEHLRQRKNTSLQRKGLYEHFTFAEASYSCRSWAIRPSFVSNETPRSSKFGCSRVISMDSQTNSPANSTASAIS